MSSDAPFAPTAVERPISRSRSTSPRAVRGLIDVSGWDFDRHYVELDGQWELYFGQLLEPSDFNSSAERPAGPSDVRPTPQLTGYVPVPGSWQSVTTDEPKAPKIPRYGAATYRLVVTGLPQGTTRPWTLEIPYARTAYRLWVNGELVASNGVVSSDPGEMRPQYSPVAATLPAPTEGSFELVMQISNAQFRTGGLPRSLFLGDSDMMARERQKRLMFQMFTIGATGLMCLVYAMMYLWRPRERSAFYFAVATGAVAIRTFFSGELPIVILFPDIPWELQLRGEYVTTNVATGFFVLFLRSLLPLDVPRWIGQLGLGLAVIGGLGTLILPASISSHTIPIYSVITAFFIYYGMYVLVRALVKKRKAIEFTVAGGIIFLVMVFLTMFHYNQILINLDLVPLGIFILLLSQGLTLSRRYALTFRQTEELARQNGLLLEETQRQLAERNRLSRLLAEQDEKTRQSIAEMLHGRTQARLLAASQQVQQAMEAVALNKSDAIDYMQSAQNLIEQVRQQDIRDASHRLHPAAIGAGLVGALDALGKQLGSDVQFDFSVDPRVLDIDDPAESRLKQNVRLGLYRIVEEALNNIQRHAHARRVQLSLRLIPTHDANEAHEAREPHKPHESHAAYDATPRMPGDTANSTVPGADSDWLLELVVADDGVGFDPDTASHNLGLELIAARAADLGARWRISSTPGHGTRLWVAVPLEGATTIPGSGRKTHSSAT